MITKEEEKGMLKVHMAVLEQSIELSKVAISVDITYLESVGESWYGLTKVNEDDESRSAALDDVRRSLKKDIEILYDKFEEYCDIAKKLSSL